MTMNDINLVLHKITLTQIETLNLINNVHRPKDFRMKRSLLPITRLFHFLFGTAKDEDVKSMKQDITRHYDNHISQSKVLNDVISIANISKGLINENILRINQIISTITFLNDMMDIIVTQLRPLFYCTLKHLYTMPGSDHFWAKCKLTLPRLMNTSKFISQEN